MLPATAARFAALSFALLFFVSSAEALDGYLVGLGGSDTVFVWKSKQAQGEAMDLIQAGVHRTNPALLLPLLACTVPSGTRAITIDAGIVTHDIMVIEGQSSGCRGNIPVESFKVR